MPHFTKKDGVKTLVHKTMKGGAKPPKPSKAIKQLVADAPPAPKSAEPVVVDDSVDAEKEGPTA